MHAMSKALSRMGRHAVIGRRYATGDTEKRSISVTTVSSDDPHFGGGSDVGLGPHADDGYDQGRGRTPIPLASNSRASRSCARRSAYPGCVRLGTGKP